MVIFFSRMTARPEKRKELAQTLESIVAQVRKKRGLLRSGFYQNFEEDNQFLLVEEWSSQEDFDDHMLSDIYTVLKGTESLLQRPLEIMTHAVDGLKESEV
jgi:quinol monooxygenase YgiN